MLATKYNHHVTLKTCMNYIKLLVKKKRPDRLNRSKPVIEILFSSNEAK